MDLLQVHFGASKAQQKLGSAYLPVMPFAIGHFFFSSLLLILILVFISLVSYLVNYLCIVENIHPTTH